MELRMVLWLLHSAIFDEMMDHTQVKMLINMEHLPGIREHLPGIETGGHVSENRVQDGGLTR